MRRRAAWVAGAALLLAGARARAAEPAAPVAVADDERDVQRMADEMEKKLVASGRLMDAPELDAYLLSVAGRLQPAEAPAAVPVRIRVLRDRHPNAVSLANGAVCVTTGLLARLDDEAELAAVLAHELSHLVHKHSLLMQRERAGALRLLLLHQLSSHSQEHERQADADSVRALSGAGYDGSAARTALEKVSAWEVAEARKDPAYPAHPPTPERVAAVSAQLASLPAGGMAGLEPYQAHLADVLAVNARLELTAARYEWAREQAEHLLRLQPRSAAGHLLLGEAARREEVEGWAVKAVAEFRQAVELDPKLAEAWRGLGLGLRKAGDDAGARDALTTYLELAPDAPDRGHVRAYLDAQSGRATP